VVKTSPQSRKVTILPSVGGILRLNWLVLSCRKDLRKAVLPPRYPRKLSHKDGSKHSPDVQHYRNENHRGNNHPDNKVRRHSWRSDFLSVHSSSVHCFTGDSTQKLDYVRRIRASSARFHNAFVPNDVHKAVRTTPRSLLSNRSAAIPATNSIRNGTATN